MNRNIRPQTPRATQPARRLSNGGPVPGQQQAAPQAGRGRGGQQPRPRHQQPQQPPVTQHQQQIPRHPIPPQQQKSARPQQPLRPQHPELNTVVQPTRPERKVEVMYPDKYQSVLEMRNELQKRYDVLVKEKTTLEAQHIKEKKILQQEKLQMEENYKVLEELVSEGSPELTTKLEETEKKISLLQQRAESKEALLVEVRTQLKSSEIKLSQVEDEKKHQQSVIKEKEDKLQKLGNVVRHLERNLESEMGKVKASQEGGKFKELYEEETRIRKDMEEKLKVAMDDSKSKQKFVQMQERINELKKQAKLKLCEKEVENRKLIETLKQKEKEISGLQEQYSSLGKETESLRVSNNEEARKLKLNIATLEREKDELNNSLADQKSSNVKSSLDYENKLEEIERKHFKQINDLQNKVQTIEVSKLEEMSKLEDEWIQKMATQNSSLEKLRIKLKVSEDMTRKAQGDKETIQAEVGKLSLCVEDLKKEKVVTDKQILEMEEELVNKESEKVALASRCEELEKRLSDSSERILSSDRLNSQRLQLEYQINFWKERAQRLENGVSVTTSDSDIKEDESKKEEVPEIDENELYLRFLELDTANLIKDLKSKIEKKDEVIEKMILESEEDKVALQGMLTKETALAALQELCASFSPVGVSHNLHNNKVDDLTRKLEIKESEVLWVKSEAEDKGRKIAELEMQVRDSKTALEIKYSAVPSPNNESSVKECCKADNESEDRIKKLQKTIETKEDHFSREIDILKSRNQLLTEKIKNVGCESNVDFVALKEKHNALIRDYENLLHNSSNLSQKKDFQLNDSFHVLEESIRSKDEELEKEKEARNLLNESLEIEKAEGNSFRTENENLRQEMSVLLGQVQALEEKECTKAKLADKEKELNLEIKILNSECERLRIEVSDIRKESKEKIKTAQEATIRAHEELFEEHETILETIKSFSSKKRKRFFDHVYETSKKLRCEESPIKTSIPDRRSDRGDSMLLDDTLEVSHHNPKDLICSSVKSPVKDVVLTDTKGEGPSTLVPVVRSPVEDSVVSEELDLEKIEFIVDQEVACADMNTINASASGDILKINLDDANFVLQDGSSDSVAAPPLEDVPSVSAAPIKILQASWV